MKTGIVLKKEGRKAILLKPDGSFVSVKAGRDWKVGETVPIPAAHRSRVTPLLAMAACLALAFLGGFEWNRYYRSPVALISLDVNPSIELSVNRAKRVVSATALNNEGTRILAETDVQNAACGEALANLLNTEGADGYLAANADVVLTVYARDASVQSALLSELQGVVDSGISHYSHQVTAEYHAVDESTVNGAHGHGVTAGKYLYLQELKQLAPDTDISQYTHHSIEQIKGEIKTCREEHAAKRGTSHHGSHRKKGHD